MNTPQDFTVSYEWHAGSMPPPYHYEYIVTLGPGTSGKVDYWPDYQGKDTPHWTEAFTPSQQQVDDLYALLIKRKALRDRWAEPKDRPVGGSVEWLSATAGGKQYSVPSNLQPQDAASMDDVYSAIKDMVPKQTWDKLEAQRQQYAQDYENKHK